MHKIIIDNQNELKNVAIALIEFAENNRFFTFEGEMGAGKTTFIKSLCDVLGVDDLVSSPTFSIVNEYLANPHSIYHFDFYRLKNIAEAYDIGYEDYFYSDNYCFVEWPQKVEELLPEQYIKVNINILGDTQREFIFDKN